MSIFNNTALNVKCGIRPYCDQCGRTVGYDLKAHQKKCEGTGKHHTAVKISTNTKGDSNG